MSPEPSPFPGAELTLERIGGRKLRGAGWPRPPAAGRGPPPFFNRPGAGVDALAPFAGALAERPVIAWDMPGIGGSPAPVVPYNPALAAWTGKALLQRFGCARADVMGLSWGGNIAQHFALQHAASTRRLVLAATNAGMVAIPGSPRALWKLANPTHWKGPGLARALGPGAEQMEHLPVPSLRSWLYQAAAITGWTSAPFLPLLKAPTLILMGSKDRIVPPVNGRILSALIPHARLEVIEGGGHLFLLGQQEQTLGLLRGFLDEPDDAR